MIKINNIMGHILLHTLQKNGCVGNFDFIYEEILNHCKLYKSLNEVSVSIEFIKKYFSDLTGYEVGNNEFFYPLDLIPLENFFDFLFGLEKTIAASNNMPFGIIVSIDKEKIFIRIHLYREQDGLWLADNLDAYDEPLLYLIHF